MKLIYRGNSYEYDPTQARTGNRGRPVRPTHSSLAPYTLRYRGLTLQIDPQAPAQVPAMPVTYDLLYRGTSYQVSRNDRGTVAITSQPAIAVWNRPRKVSPTRAVGSIHQANLLNNLQRRLQAAQERGDQTLVELLEAERQQISLR